ncbi:MAG TPA: hypothetical protein VH331_15925 [Allosphingosinicella sp.]|jgi:hypothetical protein|nr:hypothetical protein [Allosphingosinicella sp.]
MTDGEDESLEEQARRQVLVAANLFDEDPEQIAGLVFPIPAERTLAALLRDYDTQRTTNRKVRCAVCPTHTKHFRGFVGQLDDGSLALIGINCGEDRFGEGTWAEMSASLKRQQEEAYYRGRIEPARQQVEIVYPLLQEWATRLSRWRSFAESVRSRYSDFFGSLREAAVKRDGQLIREQMVFVTVVDEQGIPRQQRQPRVEVMGRIPFPAGFVAITIGDRRLTEARECVKNAYRALAPNADLRSLERAFRTLREGRKLIDEVEEFHQGWIRNSSLDWWSSACNWHNAAGSSRRLRVHGRAIMMSNDGNPIKLVVPEASPSESLFEAIAAAWPR